MMEFWERTGELPFDVEYDTVEKNRVTHFGWKDDFSLVSNEQCANVSERVYSAPCGLQIRQKLLRYSGAVRAVTEAVNVGCEEILLKKLSSATVRNIFANRRRPDLADNCRFVWIQNAWECEGSVASVPISALYAVKPSGQESRATIKMENTGSFTTERMDPLWFFEDGGRTCLFLQGEPCGSYQLELRLRDDKNLCFYEASFQTGTEDTNGFYVRLRPGERYETPALSIGLCSGQAEDCVQTLNTLRRSFVQQIRRPLVFNDYMNCLWAKPSVERTLPLAEAAARAGSEIFCMDAGWNQSSSNFSDRLGDWEPSSELFGAEGLPEIIRRINRMGMKFGIWTELECCAPGAVAARLPEDYFLHRGSVRIFRTGRFFFDFRHPGARDYLKSCVRKLWELGVRYLKNDYNASIGGGCDGRNGPAANLEEHQRSVASFFDELRDEFPDLILENCASGGLREDWFLLPRFHLQSATDCEDFSKLPAILCGTLLNLPPEFAGIWAYPWPQRCAQAGDDAFDQAPDFLAENLDCGRTAFNLSCGFLGTMYLSGRIDRADEANFATIREGVARWKDYRDFIARSNPVYPLGFLRFDEEWTFYALGLSDGRSVLLSIFFREGGSYVVPFGRIVASMGHPKSVCVHRVYPEASDELLHFDGECLKIEFQGGMRALVVDIIPESYGTAGV